MSETRYRITVRGNHIELRGHIIGYTRFTELAAAMKPFGIVVGSESPNQNDSPLPQQGDHR